MPAAIIVMKDEAVALDLKHGFLLKSFTWVEAPSSADSSME